MGKLGLHDHVIGCIDDQSAHTLLEQRLTALDVLLVRATAQFLNHQSDLVRAQQTRGLTDTSSGLFCKVGQLPLGHDNPDAQRRAVALAGCNPVSHLPRDALHPCADCRIDMRTVIDDTIDRAARHASRRRNRPDGRFVGFHLSIPCLSWSVDDRFQAVPNVSSIAQT